MSNYIDPTTPTLEQLNKLANVHPDLASRYETISKLFSLKHWHQLTVSIMELLSEPEQTLRPLDDADWSVSNTHQAVYVHVVQACANKLNPQSLAQIAASVAEGLSSETGDSADAMMVESENDNDDGEALLQSLLDSKSLEGDAGAALYASAKLTLHRIRRRVPTIPKGTSLTSLTSSSTVREIADFLRKHELTLEGLVPAVHAAYYEAAVAFYRKVGPTSKFFEVAMAYLPHLVGDNDQASTDLTKLPVDLAVEVAMAAATGEGIYGQLGGGASTSSGFRGGTPLSQVLTRLDGVPEKAWMAGWVRGIADGDVDGTRRVMEEAAASSLSEEAVTSVTEKVTLLALVRMAYRRPSSERTLTFSDVAAELRLSDVDKVEWVVMKALSLGLIEGRMDQVEGTVGVTWVMPRVLDGPQLKDLASRFGEWAGTVAREREAMAEQTIFA